MRIFVLSDNVLYLHEILSERIGNVLYKLKISMKKNVLLALALVGVMLSAQAHDQRGGGCCQAKKEVIKPRKKDISAEFALSLKGSDPLFSLQSNDLSNGTLGTIKGRYFFSNTLALRGSLGLAVARVEQGTQTNEMSALAVDAGVEKHFKGTKRLSPYIGVELNFARVDKSVNQNGGSRETVDAQMSGITGLIGADYYIAPKVYVGVEGGLVFRQSTASPEATTLGTSMRGGLRFGFVF